MEMTEKLVSGAEQRGSATVLVVEDDESLRELTTEILKEIGYDVLVASNGRQALEICEANGRNIQLMISDMVMPEMDGLQLAEKVAGAHPGMKIILMSGYTEHAVMRQRSVPPGIHFVHKPFTPTALRAKVREVLASDGKA
jgi:two-component system cell cycle sensor histidine kinase/response regulator CckA